MAQDKNLEDNKAVARKFFAGLEAGKVDDVIALFAPDATFWSPSTRATLTMPDFKQALHWVNSRMAALIKFKLGPVTAEDNRVSILVESSGTTVEGKAYNNVYNFYFEIENGRIKLMREYNDTAHVMATIRATT